MLRHELRKFVMPVKFWHSAQFSWPFSVVVSALCSLKAKASERNRQGLPFLCLVSSIAEQEFCKLQTGERYPNSAKFNMTDNYLKYRGKCYQLSLAEVAKNPELKLVRGFYYCPIWNQEDPHWWCVDKSGQIVDPSAKQFPSAGIGEYKEYDGTITCEYCGKEEKEEAACIVEHHTYCSYRCYGHDIGF